MKQRAALVILVVIAVGAAAYFAFDSFRQSSRPLTPSLTPDLANAPLRVYGVLEPAGREVFCGPPAAKRVVAVLAREGEPVAVGQALVELDAEVESAALRVAEAAVEEARARVALAEDEVDRLTRRVSADAVSQTELSRAVLTLELEKRGLDTALAALELRRAELAQLTLRSPCAGRIYKLDVKVGELLTPQDYARIVVGPQEKQVRLFVEVFWLERVRVGNRFAVRDAETLAEIGVGSVVEVLPYVGSRDFRTEDRLERLDTKYRQAILRFEAECNAPIGLLVLCERATGERASGEREQPQD